MWWCHVVARGLVSGGTAQLGGTQGLAVCIQSAFGQLLFCDSVLHFSRCGWFLRAQCGPLNLVIPTEPTECTLMSADMFATNPSWSALAMHLQGTCKTPAMHLHCACIAPA